LKPFCGKTSEGDGMHRALRYFGIGLVTLLMVIGIGLLLLLKSSLPQQKGHVVMPGLSASATIEYDRYGIPRISTQTRVDAYRLLGYASARDRLFQMDLLRRKMAGRLAEIIGSEGLDSDRWHRSLGFCAVASTILQTLPKDQRRVLEAYASGVNQGMAEYRVWPFEFLLLDYAPEPWRPEHSVLATLAMHSTLAWRGQTERMTTVIEAAFPAPVRDFFLPTSDGYTAALLAEKPAVPSAALPVEALTQILRDRHDLAADATLIHDDAPKKGSNAWVVAPAKSADGRALLANDMHLELNVPNIWYRAELLYGQVHLTGLSLPGLPLIISGSNRHIAWGFTASGADTSDLILLDVDPQQPQHYQTQQGSDHFGTRDEIIPIRGGGEQRLTVRTTPWGPVLPRPLLGKAVAVRWTALDPSATNYDLLNLDRTTTTAQALAVLNRAGGPPLNAFVADAQGNIGWTMTGMIPLRHGSDGLFAYRASAAAPAPMPYIPADRLPRRLNPPSGFVVSANQRMVDASYPYQLGLHDWRGYRAYRIRQRLQTMDHLTERDLLALQLDTQTDFYRYYQQLALRVLAAAPEPEQPVIRELRDHLRNWNGHADINSVGLGLLVEYRDVLMTAILAPYFERCRALDPTFEYHWPYADRPLQQLIDAGLPQLLPGHRHYPDPNAQLLALLLRSRDNLLERYQVYHLPSLNWGLINRTRIAHPLAAAIPWLGRRLNMPETGQPGCNECVRNFFWDGGASDRLVVAPGHEQDAILQMPTGQSGNPISADYASQHGNWLHGIASPLLAGPTVHRLIIEPAPQPPTQHR
jgi:penicillin G amidase